MIFLGTGASEAIPNPMCGCEICQKALMSPDPRERRNRSALLLDEHTLIDCGPDITASCGRFGVSLQRLESIFLTHTHSDHFSLTTLECLQMCVTPAPNVNIYLSEAAYAGLLRLQEVLLEQEYANFGENFSRWPTFCKFVPIEPFREYMIGDMRVSAVIGRHPGLFTEELSLNYLFERNTGTVFYASDTGVFFPETFAYLQGRKLDILIIENAFGKRSIPCDKGHLNLDYLYQTLDALKEQNCIHADTRIYITHIGHKAGLLHQESDDLLQSKYGGNICTAYDGLRI